MEKIDQINHEVIELWKCHVKADNRELMPLIYPPLNKEALLFVGVNPSFGKGWGWLKKTDFKDIEPHQFFSWRNFLQRNKEDSDIKKAQRIDELAKVYYDAFYGKGKRDVSL